VPVRAGALLLSLLEPLAPPELELSLDLLALSLSEPTPFFFLPVLKSVSYQPVPFSLKLGADTRRTSVLLPHSGQSESGGSLIF